jgi:hypothetical protein
LPHSLLPGSIDTMLDRSAFANGRDRMYAIVVDSDARRKEEKSLWWRE